MLTLSNAVGAMQAINAAGYAVEQRGNTLFGIRMADGATGQAIDDAIMAIDTAYPVSAAADAVCKQIEVLATSKRNQVIAGYSPGEMASWPIKRAEALAYQVSNNESDAPNLDAEASSRGITLAALVAKVLADAERFAGIEAAIAGASGRHRDAVRTLTTHADIAAYDYSVGWPL